MFGKRKAEAKKKKKDTYNNEKASMSEKESGSRQKRKLSFFQNKEEEKEEPQYFKTPTNLMALNYRVYNMSVKEKVCYTIIAFMIGAIVGYIFYGGMMKDDLGNPTVYTYGLNAIIMMLTGLIFSKIYVPMRREELRKARQDKLKIQFRDMLEAFATSLGAGRNVTDSFSATYDDLGNQYESTAFILQELKIINVGIINGLGIEELLSDFGYRSGCEDIENFANVFEICYRRGGNIKETVRNTCDIIGDKMAIMENIETIITSSKSELKLMLVLPMLMILLMKGSSTEFAANFATPAGIISTTIALVFVVIAYLIGQKIMDIKV